MAHPKISFQKSLTLFSNNHFLSIGKTLILLTKLPFCLHSWRCEHLFWLALQTRILRLSSSPPSHHPQKRKAPIHTADHKQNNSEQRWKFIFYHLCHLATQNQTEQICKFDREQKSNGGKPSFLISRIPQTKECSIDFETPVLLSIECIIIFKLHPQVLS